MPFKPGNTGKPKGTKNKATRDIRALIQRTVDFEALTKELVILAQEKKEKWAFDMLYQYGFGKPVEIQIAAPPQGSEPFQHEHSHKVDPKSMSALSELAKKFSTR